MCGVRTSNGSLRSSRATYCGTIAAGGVESRRGRCLSAEGPTLSAEVGKPAGGGHLAHVSAQVGRRYAGASDPGAGSGRIRGGLADPRCALDREPDRSAADDRSGTAGGYADVIVSLCPRVLYPLPFGLLDALPHGEGRPAVWNEWRSRGRLCLVGERGARRALSPLR